MVIEYVALVLCGILGGFLSGFLGIGGGIIYISAFPIFLINKGISEELIVPMTVANSILATLISSLAANLTEIYKKGFYWRESIIVGIASTISAFFCLRYILYEPWYSQKLFTSLIILVLIYLMFSTWKNSRKSIQGLKEREKNKGLIFSVSGILSGTVASLTGLGGGAIIIPLFAEVLKMDIKKAKSISLGLIFITSSAITIYNYLISVEEGSANFLSLELSLPVAIGVLLASPFGVIINKKVSSRFIGIFFSLFLLLVIIFKIYRLYT
ncbi:MAG: sulfite exporter TauE/SafE family protein [Bacteroidota bacterium]